MMIFIGLVIGVQSDRDIRVCQAIDAVEATRLPSKKFSSWRVRLLEATRISCILASRAAELYTNSPKWC